MAVDVKSTPMRLAALSSAIEGTIDPHKVDI